jgi:serine/threonine protein kinase
MHCRLSHPKIIQLIDIHIDLAKEITYMVLEYAEEGTLYDKIKMAKLSKHEIKKYFRDVCEGLAYLHEQGIMHRDVKVLNNSIQP